MERLSSGLRIVNSSDDPSGKKLVAAYKTQANGLRVANKGLQDAISFLQVRASAMDMASEIIQRLRDLAVRASSDTTLTAADRTNMATEADGLIDSLNLLNDEASFNGILVFGPSFSTVPGGSSALVHAGQVSMSVDLASYAASNGGVADIYGAWYDGAAMFPDFNLISPDGTEAFGYLYYAHESVPPGTVEAYVGGGGVQTVNNGAADPIHGLHTVSLGTMNSATSIKYSGYAGYAGAGGWQEESFKVTNPAAGLWTIIVDNEQPVAKKFGIFINEPAIDPVDRDYVQVTAGYNMRMQIGMYEINSLSLGVSADYSSAANAQATLSSLDDAISNLADRMTENSAMIGNIEKILDDNQVALTESENALSRIQDADVASEMTNLTRYQILSMAGVSVFSSDLVRVQNSVMRIIDALPTPSISSKSSESTGV